MLSTMRTNEATETETVRANCMRRKLAPEGVVTDETLFANADHLQLRAVSGIGYTAVCGEGCGREFLARAGMRIPLASECLPESMVPAPRPQSN